MRAFTLSLVVLVWCALVRPAAGVTFLEVMGAPHTRHPYLARVMPVGPASAYFNPGMLIEDPNTVLIGPFVHYERLRVRLDPRPPEADVPRVFLQALDAPGGEALTAHSTTLPTADLPRPRRGQDVSRAVFCVGQGTSTQVIPGRLAVGLYLLLVGDAFHPQEARFADEREQAFSNRLGYELYGERLSAVAFAFGLAGRPLEWLTLGAGISLGFASEVRVAGYYPNEESPEDLQLRTTSSLNIRLQPQFSVSVAPLEGLSVSVTLHLPYANVTRGRGDFLIRASDGGAEGSRAHDMELAARHGDLPWRVGLGAAYVRAPGSGFGFGVGAQAVIAQWSTYRDRAGERPRGWSETVTLAAGGELLWRAHAWAVNLQWVPSPVPAQTGRTNYVDSPRLGFSLGWESRFQVGPIQLLAGVNLSAQALLPVSTTKSPEAAYPVRDELPDTAVGLDGAPLPEAVGLQTNNPGYPGYSSSGWLLGFGATLRVLF